jgi:dGTPase
MGVGEGDFHRTRLTHSIECAQIGGGILDVIRSKSDSSALAEWLPPRDLIEAACFAHDLGHPPFGHKGEEALHSCLGEELGFEGNGQTLRILTRLEKARQHGAGIDPTRRLTLAVLKYPVAFGDYAAERRGNAKPPKCYHDEEREIFSWASEIFSSSDINSFRSLGEDGKPKYRTVDCGIMELADDIAYGVHDLEDIVARKLASKRRVEAELVRAFHAAGGSVSYGGETFTPELVLNALFDSSFSRKAMVAALVNLFVTNCHIELRDEFEHPLLRLSANLPADLHAVLEGMKKMTFRLVVQGAPVQQLERRGMMIVSKLYEALSSDPTRLIPTSAWADGDATADDKRRVCDFIAGMTDQYAERTYKRLYIPGWGSSSDEL